jgi:NAD(P)-dependent dehydrogenase (short-subunit alcohol dehydrogenase family)
MTEIDLSTGVALVAGGSGGIGAAIVEAFARAGSAVVFTYHRNRDAAHQVCEAAAAHGVAVEYHQLALHDNDATAALLAQVQQKYGAIHSVVYAAGPGIPVNFAGEINFDDWKATFEHDTHACFSLVHAALPILKDQGSGSICAITTTQASRHLPLSVLSSAPKAAVESLLEVVARENGRYGIRANSIRSGWLAGGKLDRGMDGQMNDEALQKIAAQVPLGHLGTPEDVANAVVFLASQQGRYINGVNLAVDGGWCL